MPFNLAALWEPGLAALASPLAAFPAALEPIRPLLQLLDVMCRDVLKERFAGGELLATTNPGVLVTPKTHVLGLNIASAVSV